MSPEGDIIEVEELCGTETSNDRISVAKKIERKHS